MTKEKESNGGSNLGHGQLIANDKTLLVAVFLLSNSGSGIIGTLSGITLQSPPYPAVESRITTLVQAQEEHGRGLANIEATFREYQSDVRKREARYLQELSDSQRRYEELETDIEHTQKRIETVEHTLKRMNAPE